MILCSSQSVTFSYYLSVRYLAIQDFVLALTKNASLIWRLRRSKRLKE